MLKFFLKDSWPLFVVVVLSSFAVTFLSTIVPKVIGFTVDSVLGDLPVPGEYEGIVLSLGGIDRIKSNIWMIAVAITIIAAVTFIFHYLRIYISDRANQTLVRRMRDTLFYHVQRLPLSWHKAHMTGDLIQRATSDIDAISNFITNQLLSLFRITLMLVLSVVFMFTINVKLAGIALAFVPLLIGYSMFFYLRAGKRFKKCDEEEGVLSTIAQENLTGVRVVRAFGRERFEREKFDRQNTYYTGLWVNLERFMAMYWATSDLIAALQLMFIIIIGSVFCVGGEMSAGDLVAFVSYNTMMIGPVRMLGRIISNLSKAGVALDRIAEIMNGEQEEYGEPGAVMSGDIVFDNVSFCYEKDKPVLSDISFTVPEGSTLGVLGGTGSGKSTLMYLFDRLYEPDGGSITVGGVPLSDIPRATVRRDVGFILQESYIYSRKVGENIAIAADGASEEDIAAAAKLACVDDNIRAFTEGYDTTVGERGVTLSGGQKQRIAIARTLLRDTPYVVFDDSLSAVDSETDTKIRGNLRETKGKTTVIISHRITTVMHADNIIVMENGRIAESGTHAQLLEKGGIYKRIYDMQMALPDELKAEVKVDGE